MRSVGLLLALTLLALPAEAQRRRSSSHSSGRGVPCGNSYISADKVCHKDTPPAQQATTGADSARALSAPAQLLATPSVAAQPSAPAPAAASYAPLAASLQPFIGATVALRNVPAEEKWQRQMVLSEILGDHIVVIGNGHVLHIPFSALAYAEMEVGSPKAITLVFRN